MLNRRTTGSIVCPSCGSLVGVGDDACYSCGRANPGLWGFGPVLRRLGADFGFVPLVVGGSTLLYLLTLVASGSGLTVMRDVFSILSPSLDALVRFGASGSVPFFGMGAWWTVLSASWLHGSLLHILFNMMWVRDLGPATANVIGPARTVVIYTIAGACGFILSSAVGRLDVSLPFLRGASYTVGASASIFGLLGALVHYGRKSGSSLIHAEAKRYAIILFAMGLLMPGVSIDNFAHAGGFVGGYATSVFFNPLTRERGDHMLLAIGCLAATALAILTSIARSL